MNDAPHPVDVVTKHPRVADLGRTPNEQIRVAQFALDLARWLYGEPRETLRPLARVVTVVASRELRDPKRLCRGHPLMAVEAAARATQALWPLLQGPLEEEESSPPEPEPPAGDEAPQEGAQDEAAMQLGADAEGAGQGEGAPGAAEVGEPGEEEAPGEEGAEAAEEDGAGEEEYDMGPPTEEVEQRDTEDLLRALAEQEDLLDPELQNLADRLRESLGGEATDEMQLGAAANETLSRAAEAACAGAMETERVSRHLENFLPGVGWSVAPGQLHLSLLERLDRLARLLANLEELDDLADALGRMEGETDEEGKNQGGCEEIVGVKLGGSVARALPSELGLLGDPEMEDLFYQRLVEQRLICLEDTGAGMDGEAAGERRGPVIACIDTSGSMEGSRELAAKALVLAICRRALPQGRTVHLILFSGPQDRVELRLRRGLGGLEDLIGFLGMAFHGGTDFDVPLARAVELLEERDLERADVLVVTDGLARASAEIVASVGRVREERGVRVWSVVLGEEDTYGVRPFSDQIWVVDTRRAARAAGLLSRFDR